MGKIDVSFIKNDKVGKVLCRGLAQTYKNKPKFPVDFFAKWLLNYCDEQKSIDEVIIPT